MRDEADDPEPALFGSFALGREGDEALASLRAAVVPGGDIVLESTANGAWDIFIGSGSELRRRDISGIFPVVVRGKLCGGAGAVVVVVDGGREGADERTRVECEAELRGGGSNGRHCGGWQRRNSPRTRCRASGRRGNACLRWRRWKRR